MFACSRSTSCSVGLAFGRLYLKSQQWIINHFQKTRFREILMANITEFKIKWRTLCCELRTVETAAVVVVLWMQHCILSPFVAFVSGHPHSSCLLSAACRAFLCFSINWVTIVSTVSAVFEKWEDEEFFRANCDAFLLLFADEDVIKKVEYAYTAMLPFDKFYYQLKLRIKL